MPQTNQFWFILFTIASKIYGWFILFSILIFLYTVLKPYGLQSIGQSLAVFSVVGIMVQMGTGVYQILSAPREEPIQKWRIVMTTIVLGSAITGLGMYEIPFIQWAAFVIEPRDVHHVVTKIPGELAELHVRPGDHVEAGQLLAVLKDPQLEMRKREWTSQLELKRTTLKIARAVHEPGEEAMAQEAVDSMEEQLSELAERMKHLIIRAPISGTVVEPQREPSPTIHQLKTRLYGWSGSVLSLKNSGAFVAERTRLMSIAPLEGMQANLYLNQGDRQDVTLGTKVGLKFDHLPNRVFRGTVSQIATAQTDYSPETLAVKNGGLLATTTDQEGREMLQEAAYQATVVLDESPELLRTNLRGNARFMAANRSVFGWVWRYVRRTFHFKM